MNKQKRQEPSGDCALWLMLDPEPCDLDHCHPYGTAARLRDALRALHRTTDVGARCKTKTARHLASVRELSIIDLAIVGMQACYIDRAELVRAMGEDVPERRGKGRLWKRPRRRALTSASGDRCQPCRACHRRLLLGNFNLHWLFAPP